MPTIFSNMSYYLTKKPNKHPAPKSRVNSASEKN